MYITAILSIAAFMLSGCVTNYNLSPTARGKQETIYSDGYQFITSDMKNTTIMVSSEPQALRGGKSDFVVVLRNRSKDKIDFSVSNISLATRDKTKIKVYTYAELKKEMEYQQNMEALTVGLNSLSRSINAANTGYSTTTGNYNYNYSSATPYNYNNTHSGSGTGTYIQQTYNPAAQSQAISNANAINQLEVSNLKKTHANKLNSIKSLLKRETVFPDSAITGFIKTDTPKVDKALGSKVVVLTVNVAGEEHKFDFTYRLNN